MELHLIDRNPEIVEAWKIAFRPYPEVHIIHGDILQFAEDAVVSPANSSGIMDGGIDRIYREFFGLKIEEAVRKAIARRAGGILPVGAGLVVPTEHPRIRFLIVAPTMECPEAVPPHNTGRATYAALRATETEPMIKNLFCPGMATGVGMVPTDIAAQEMAAAFSDWRQRSERQ